MDLNNVMVMCHELHNNGYDVEMSPQKITVNHGLIEAVSWSTGNRPILIDFEDAHQSQ